MTLPQNIAEIFYQTLSGKISFPEFETRLYANGQLESILPEETYIDLIAHGYREKNAADDLFKILERIIDKGEYEKWKLLGVLNKALQRDGDFAATLMEFYSLYCKGYSFLDVLGADYGLRVKVPLPLDNNWEDLTPVQQQRLLDSFYPEIEDEIKKAIGWLESGQIIPTGIRDGEYNHFQYIDNRH